MGLPLAAGHVLVRLADGPPEAAHTVLDALETVFPNHTGRGRTRVGNVWEDPPTVTSEGTRVVAGPRPAGAPPRAAPAGVHLFSQAFDARSGRDRATPTQAITLAGGIDADLLGGHEDVERVLTVLTALCGTVEQEREAQGPHLAVRLRLGPPG
ncbi:hypothetical protein ACFV0O_31080 [Kitasatospora sp. NPDC059577]|uniref:hypothetical protein n=1 Tax=Kitasatospora sp. NPDC059577 TaxID=3346873 RepID=UPI0036CC62B8